MLTRNTLIFGLLCGSCAPADDHTRARSMGATTGTSSAETASLFVPHAFGVGTLQFGYDAATGMATPVKGLDDYGNTITLPIRLDVQILSQAALTDGLIDGVNMCTVTLERKDSIPVASWSGPAGAWFAFEVAYSSGTQSCGQLDFPEKWGLNPADHITKWSWGAGVQPLTEDALEILGEGWTSWEPWIVGGGYWWQELNTFTGGTADGGSFDPDGYVDAGIAWVWEVDPADMSLVYMGDGGKTPVGADVVLAGTALVSGWYEVQVVRYLTPADRLLETPP